MGVINLHKARVFLFPVIFILSASVRLMAQSPFKGFEKLFTVPRSYVIQYTNTAPAIDGDINDDAWKQAQWTEDFRDIEGDIKPKPYLQTKVKMLWNDSCLYIAAQMQEPQLFAYQKHHDDVVFHDNDFEVFINPSNTGHQYYEIEVNALNTIFDLFLNTPYRDNGSAMINWNAEGLRSAVKLQGTLNNPSDIDKGWTVEMAIPFRAISIGNDVFIPKDGTLWRINFSRVEWDTKVNNGKYINQSPEHNWTWSQQGVVDMHFPERWGYLQFSKSVSGNITFILPYNELQRQYLWLIYYQEHAYYTKYHAYTSKLKIFGLCGNVMVDGRQNSLKLEATAYQFTCLITDDNDKTTWTIDQQGEVRQLN
jgi:hypothetical protein